MHQYYRRHYFCFRASAPRVCLCVRARACACVVYWHILRAGACACARRNTPCHNQLNAVSRARVWSCTRVYRLRVQCRCSWCVRVRVGVGRLLAMGRAQKPVVRCLFRIGLWYLGRTLCSRCTAFCLVCGISWSKHPEDLPFARPPFGSPRKVTQHAARCCAPHAGRHAWPGAVRHAP